MKIDSEYLAGRDINIHHYPIEKTKEEKRQEKIWQWIILGSFVLLVMVLFGVFYQEFVIEKVDTTVKVENVSIDNKSTLKSKKEEVLSALNTDRNKKNKERKQRDLVEKIPNNTIEEARHSTKVQSQDKEERKEQLIVKLSINSDFMDGDVFVDGKKATITDDNGTLKDLLVFKKESVHHIQIVNGKDTCSISAFIVEMNQKVNCSDI